MDKFQIYGDESISDYHVLYGLLIAPTEIVSKAEWKLELIKSRHGVPSSAKLHCRELLAPHARKKSDWRNLSDKQAIDLIIEAATELAGIGLRTRVGCVTIKDMQHQPYQVGDSGMMIASNPKQLIPTAFAAAVSQLLFDPEYADNSSLWISPERSAIDWFGGSRQVDQLLRINRIDQKEKLIERMLTPVNAESKECPVLLEVADLLVYTTQRKLSHEIHKRNRYSDQVFDAIFKSMSPSVAHSSSPITDNDRAVTGVLENYVVKKRN